MLVLARKKYEEIHIENGEEKIILKSLGSKGKFLHIALLHNNKLTTKKLPVNDEFFIELNQDKVKIVCIYVGKNQGKIGLASENPNTTFIRGELKLAG